MDSKDIKFNQYYRVGLKSIISNNVYYVIGYFINMRETDGFISSLKFLYFHDMGALKKISLMPEKYDRPYIQTLPTKISQCRYHICLDEILTIEEFDEKDLEEELFINGL